MKKITFRRKIRLDPPFTDNSPDYQYFLCVDGKKQKDWYIYCEFQDIISNPHYDIVAYAWVGRIKYKDGFNSVAEAKRHLVEVYSVHNK